MRNYEKKGRYGCGRTRNFATVVYKESAPDDWMEILRDEMIPAFVSPYHDSDVNPDGTPKKPHYHVMLMFESVKTVEQASEVFKKIGGVGCEKVNNVRSYGRYLCHLDNPEKHQYSPTDVKSFSGADYLSIIGTPADRYKAIREMQEFCDQEHIVSFAALMRYAASNRDDWFRLLCDNSTYVIDKFLKAKMWERNIENENASIPDAPSEKNTP